MKIKSVPTILLASCLIAFTACHSEPKDLTPQKAERAFAKICPQPLGNGQLRFPDGHVETSAAYGPERCKIDGVRTEKSNGMTVVDATLPIYFYASSTGEREQYSGPAVGYFVGYTDGRYTLVRLELTKGQDRGNVITITFQDKPSTD